MVELSELVGVVDKGTPVNVGELLKTNKPLPVSLLQPVKIWALVNDPNEVTFPTLLIIPDKFAFVVTVAEFPVVFWLNVGQVWPVGNTIFPVKVGLLLKTIKPVPVSSEQLAKIWADVKDPNEVVFPTDEITPDKLAFVVTVAAFPVVFWLNVGQV